MKKSIISSILITVTMSTLGVHTNLAHADDNNMSRLQTSGTEIQKDGQEYQLKGVNAGNVFTTESWLGGYARTVEEKHDKGYQDVFDKTQEKMGGNADKAHEVLEKYADNRWDDKDFENVKKMGGNTIRLPINYINITNYDKKMEINDDKEIDPRQLQIRQEGIDTIKRFVQKAKDHGLYVILDMHGAPNGQNGDAHSTYERGSHGKFWDNEDAKGKMKEIWDRLSKEFKDEDAVAGYDILNEPMGPDGVDGINKASDKNKARNDLQNFYKDTLEIFKNNNDNHIAFLESTWEPDVMKDFDNSNNNIVYEYHNYPMDKDVKTHDKIKDNFDQKVDRIKNADDEYNVPTYMGEFNGHKAGEVPDGAVMPNSKDFKHMIKKLNDNNMSWSIWNYDEEGKNNNDSTWGVLNFDGINTNTDDEDDFGKKINPEVNNTVFNAIKEANK
ncbi:cellulase family glycosylhydrolase [Staphylococcus epidermidis]|jgi:endoglucanase|uniref:glycoside hydrolase family 5 protein n=1 Tax=Staphylococcus TaxID=1279 RepID=UPI0008AA5289|nr:MULTISPECIES: cellulase family glycosylhydrolase [Staphylococcus]ECO2926593.1 glycoside hydrolase family 5 protein [Campylobacter jejuni]KAB2277891.1 glycoside hydrolase family 5 protein [Staphylococcus epidermidis]MBC3076877.1 cellulase family glycosylhydrolase [Staphylococcus epidermidis]MBM6048824.1 cellulase family glycosylhydrolase [Staphylococcus epidermidis]MCG2184689.1 cellulase family glycosylhydrolase [Staphylococcus epidermidis]